MKEERTAVEFQLSFSYEQTERNVLDEVTGRIPNGSCIVLCGESGCGKSTLLRCMNQLIPQFYEGSLKGFLKIAGKDLSKLSIGETGQLAVSVFQDPRSQFFTLNSLTEVAFGLENFGKTHQEMVERVEAVFREFHLEHLKDRNVFSLSSGERQLVAILAAYAVNTEVFLLDEPTANLDAAAVEQLKTMLTRLKAEKKTMLISEHRLYYLNHLADEYWYLENGNISRRFTRQEMNELSPEERERLGLRTVHLAELQPSEPKAVPEHSPVHRFSADQISFGYEKKKKPVLKQLSFEAKTGEVVGIIGSNGCGKTTFGKLASGLLKPCGGTFSLDGKVLTGQALSQNSIFIMQEAEFQFFTNSVVNEVSYGMERTEENKEQIRTLLKETGLWECRKQHPFSLSGGQMQRLVLLLAYLSPKPVVVLDEPTAGLDFKNMKICAGLLERMRRDKIILVITHDAEFIAKACTRCVCFGKGNIQGAFSLHTPEGFAEVKRFLEADAVGENRKQEASVRKAERFLDPRMNLFLAGIAVFVGIGTDLPMILAAFGAVLTALFYQNHYRTAIGSALLMTLVFLLNAVFPDTLFSFVVYFFSRVILIGAAAGLLVSEREAPRILAGLRKMHIPEQAVMVLSVIFRFFPVLRADLKIMAQSLQTRGLFTTFAEKLKAIPAYAEILIVPMVFRVIRIAEALSASAETRGISLPGRRESYIEIGFHRMDAGIAVLVAILVGTGFLF